MKVKLIKNSIEVVNAKLVEVSFELRKGIGLWAIDMNDKYSGGDLKVAFAGTKKDCYIFITGLEEGILLKENIR